MAVCFIRFVLLFILKMCSRYLVLFRLISRFICWRPVKLGKTCKIDNHVLSLKSGMGGGQEQLYFMKLKTKPVRSLILALSSFHRKVLLCLK